MDDSAETAANQHINTTLTVFFRLSQNYQFVRMLLYPEAPSYYTWDTPRRKFNRYKRGIPVDVFEGVFKDIAIGPVYMIHPKNPILLLTSTTSRTAWTNII